MGSEVEVGVTQGEETDIHGHYRLGSQGNELFVFKSTSLHQHSLQ